MKLPRLNDKWVLILVVVIIPIILLGVLALLKADVCILMIILVWIGAALLMIYLPRVPE